MNVGLMLFCGVILIVAVYTVLLLAVRSSACKAGHREGYKSGYTQGRKDADNWWVGVESEVDQARVKIWREEAQL